MNKTLLIFLAVALVSVHAFVKRDAPKTESIINFEAIEKQLSELKSQAEKALNPDEMKKNFNEFIDNMTKTLNSFQKTENPK